MGKLNVAKMANFMEVDCYVLVSCPENSLIDSKVCYTHFLSKQGGETQAKSHWNEQEFYRPIVTPFELEIALIRYY